MRRTSLLVALMLVVGMLAAPTVGAVTQDEQSEDENVAPGEHLSGVVGVQEAEIDGELERNAFAIALERADDNATKASTIAEKLDETEERLATLEERKAELDEQRESGEITEGRYRAEIATLATEAENVERQLDQSSDAAGELPEDVLEENGVNVSAIQTLQENATDLSGEEVAEIARSIAGDDRGEVDREDRADDQANDAQDRSQDERPADNRSDDAQDHSGDDEQTDEERSDDGETDAATEGDDAAEDDEPDDAADSGENAGSDGGESAGSDAGSSGGV